VGALVLGVAVAIGFQLLPESPANEPTVPRAPTTPRVTRIDELNLNVRFPPGWRKASHLLRSSTEAGSSVTGVLLFKGESEDKAAQQVFFGMVHRHPEPDGGTGAASSDAALIAWTQAAEKAAAARLSDPRAYASSGCQVTPLGKARAGHCQGVAVVAGTSLAFHTYLRLGERRAVLAVFMDSGPTDAGHESSVYDEVVASAVP
jgi:hypothetical protein